MRGSLPVPVRAAIEPVLVEAHPGYSLCAPGGEWEATFVTSLGMVGRSLRHRGQELLAQRGGVEAYAERGSTFGIPLLHPWANRLASPTFEVGGHRVSLDPASPRVRLDGDTGLPIHGLLAAVPYWQVTQTLATERMALMRADLDFGAHADLMAGFPFAHRLEISICLDDSGLTVALTVVPTGDAAVPVCFGFHPYLQLPADRGACGVTLDVRRRLELDGQGLPNGQHQIVADQALNGSLAGRDFDDCFDGLAGAQPSFSLSGGGRETVVTFAESYPVCQVFSPAGADFVCFEPMTAPVNALISGQALPFAAPGGSFRATFAITSRSR